MPTYIDDTIAAQAWAVLDENDRGTYTVPSPKLFPFQWNWDSPLIAMALAHRDENRALIEIETLLDSQWPSGMVPHIIYHVPSDGYFPGPDYWGSQSNPPTSGISQPPIAATCLRYIVEQSSTSTEALRPRIAKLVRKLAAWHKWWHVDRDIDGSGLVSLVHPWESGRDNSADWDVPFANFEPTVDASSLRKDTLHVNPEERPTDAYYNRVMSLISLGRSLNWDDARLLRESPFLVCDIGVQSILIRADADLLWLMDYVGGDPLFADIKKWREVSRQATQRLWDNAAQAFKVLDQRTGQLVPSVSAAGFLPLYAGSAMADQAAPLVDTMSKQSSKFQFGFPQVLPNSPGYQPLNYCRGPSWPYLNRLLAEGFENYGFFDQSAQLAEDTQNLIAGQGFREYYDPRDGTGLGGTQFGWTAAAWLVWAGLSNASNSVSKTQ